MDFRYPPYLSQTSTRLPCRSKNAVVFLSVVLTFLFLLLIFELSLNCFSQRFLKYIRKVIKKLIPNESKFIIFFYPIKFIFRYELKINICIVFILDNLFCPVVLNFNHFTFFCYLIKITKLAVGFRGPGCKSRMIIKGAQVVPQFMKPSDRN